MRTTDDRVVTQTPSRGNSSPSRTRSYGRLLANRYLRHNILLLGTNIVAGILAYLLHPVLGHMMGISLYGQVAALIALSVVLLTPSQLVATVAAKYASSLSVTRNFAQLSDFIRHFTLILLPIGIGIAAIFAAASSYVAAFFHISSREGVVLLGLVFVVSFVAPLNLGILQGLQLFGWYAAITLVSAFLRLALPVALVFMGLGINGAMLGIALSALVGYVGSFQPLRDMIRGPRESAGSLRSVWIYALLAAGAAAGIVALLNVDTVLARHYLSASDAGLYAALAVIGRTVLFITSSVTLVMFPTVVALHERKEHHAHVAVWALVAALALGGSIEAVFYIAPSVVAKLLFGQAFVALASTLPLYGMAMLLLAMAQVLATYFLAIGNRVFILMIFLACLLEVALIAWHHATVSEVALAVVFADAGLLLALLIAFGMPFIQGTASIPSPELGDLQDGPQRN
jgi:O-antigen/teichoic acid export membrane protein